MTRLGLSMIVRDAGALLEQCLSSVCGVVDEIVLADTGSADDTIAIAVKLGARIVSIPWNDDFAEARNLALKEITASWVLSLDADEQLDPAAANEIPALIASATAHAYLVTIRNYVSSLDDRVWDRPAKPNDSMLPAAIAYPAYVEHENVRLFRRDPEIYFVGRVHESVGPRIQPAGRKLGKAGFFIHHFGLAASEEIRARKNRYYRELGQRKIREMPANAQAHFELGLVEMDNFGNLEEALKLFQRACALSCKFALAWFFHGLVLLKLEKYREALCSLAEAEKLGHRTSLVAETRGDAHYNCGEFRQACDCYNMAIHRDPGNALLESKAGLAGVRAGETKKGLSRLRQAVASRPQSAEVHDRLIYAFVALGDLLAAAKAAEAKLKRVPRPIPADYLRAASLWAKVEDRQRAEATLQFGLEAHPESKEIQRCLRERS